ncbi:hypothetical protein [Rhodoferax sp. WC2427]|uniref:hypothetical protein n=1 Tax=Rhodoferax sp. WC2427 TaxID=3234144 RepID=UPI0034664A27
MAQLEVAEAFQWYGQSHIKMGEDFLAELERTDRFLARNPYLCPCVELEVRRANLTRFPYALFCAIDGDTVNVLSGFHQHRNPLSRAALLGLT